MESIHSALNVVTCETCKNFIPDEHNALCKGGTCNLDGDKREANESCMNWSIQSRIVNY